MPLAKEVKSKFILDYHRHDTDTGSPEVQVAIITARIQQLTEHLRANKHDEFVPAWASKARGTQTSHARLPATGRLSALLGNHGKVESAAQIDPEVSCRRETSRPSLRHRVLAMAGADSAFPIG